MEVDTEPANHYERANGVKARSSTAPRALITALNNGSVIMFPRQPTLFVHTAEYNTPRSLNWIFRGSQILEDSGTVFEFRFRPKQAEQERAEQTGATYRDYWGQSGGWFSSIWQFYSPNFPGGVDDFVGAKIRVSVTAE